MAVARLRTAFSWVLLGTAVACGGGSDAGSEGESGASGSEDASTDADDSTADAGDGDADSETGPTNPSDEGGDGDTGTPLPNAPENLPEVTGTCPDFMPGSVTFAPAGIDPRPVQMWISNVARDHAGPLVFYWHGLGSQPSEAAYGLSQAVIDDILNQGGIVVAPSSSPNSGQFPWFMIAGTGVDDDMVLADEIVACAMQEAGIDPRRIHSTGMSAGGLQTTQFAAHRSNYIASAAPYSGGAFTPTNIQDPENKFAAMIIHGGATDVYGGTVNFEQTSTTWYNQLVGNGQFAFMCNHEMGHTIPAGLGDDIWQFFQDHYYQTQPSPYEAGLPGSFPEYCAL